MHKGEPVRSFNTGWQRLGAVWTEGAEHTSAPCCISPPRRRRLEGVVFDVRFSFSFFFLSFFLRRRINALVVAASLLGVPQPRQTRADRIGVEEFSGFIRPGASSFLCGRAGVVGETQGPRFVLSCYTSAFYRRSFKCSISRKNKQTGRCAV